MRFRPSSRWRFAATLAVLAGVGACSITAADQPGSVVCRWSARDSIKVGGDLAYLELPQVIGPAPIVLLSGQALRRNRSGQVIYDSAGKIWYAGIEVEDGSGKLIPLPTGVPTLGQPRAVRSASGIEVLWVGPSSETDTTRRLRAMTYATGRWSRPETVSAFPVNLWTSTNASALVSSSNDLTLGFPIASDSLGIVQRHGGRWTSTAIQMSLVRYVALASGSATMVAAVIADSGILAGRMGNDGPVARWSLIAPSAHAADAHFPLLIPTRGDSVVLVWMTGFGRDSASVELAVSADGARTWRLGATMIVPSGLHSLDATSDGSGGIVVAGRSSGAGGLWPFAARWNSRTWTRFASPSVKGENGIVSPRLSYYGDSVHMFWNVVPTGKEESEPPVLVHAAWGGSCGRNP